MQTISKIKTVEEAIKLVHRYKKENRTIVFSNGCFDILHAGHVDYLEKAKEKGDLLVVGLNTDASVRRIKGTDRPVNNEVSRARVLAGLACIDVVVFFDSDTPIDLIREINPDVLVKGKDYDISNIVGADIVLQNGGKVETIQLTEGLSTTSVIDKIRKTK